ncbi:MAG: Undecaprenyl-phosphate mannosyltransferase [Actinobacteria bacterium]|nr:Undecaprenyl-phosphate mannosyltransferase [Actinomycetota bacterium]
MKEASGNFPASVNLEAAIAARKVLAIIPAYNEEKNISRVIQGIRRFSPSLDILVVDDCSADRTAAVAMEEGAEVISLPFNLGYGVACQTGFKYAVGKKYDLAVQIDGDGQHDPSYINALLKEVFDGTVDVAIGSRFLGKSAYRAPLLRKLGMFLFGIIASVLIGQRVTDPTSGFQALNSKVLRFFAQEVYPVDYPDADVLVLLHYARFKIREMPVRMYENVDKSMHKGLKSFYYVFKMVLSILVTMLSKRHILRKVTRPQ